MHAALLNAAARAISMSAGNWARRSRAASNALARACGSRGGTVPHTVHPGGFPWVRGHNRWRLPVCRKPSLPPAHCRIPRTATTRQIRPRDGAMAAGLPENRRSRRTCQVPAPKLRSQSFVQWATAEYQQSSSPAGAAMQSQRVEQCLMIFLWYETSRCYEQGRTAVAEPGMIDVFRCSALKSMSPITMLWIVTTFSRGRPALSTSSRAIPRTRPPRPPCTATIGDNPRESGDSPPLGRGEFPRQRVVLVDYHLGPAGICVVGLNGRCTLHDIVCLARFLRREQPDILLHKPGPQISRVVWPRLSRPAGPGGDLRAQRAGREFATAERWKCTTSSLWVIAFVAVDGGRSGRFRWDRARTGQ